MKDVMVDLETLNNVPGGVIISIGAVAFDWRRDCLGNEFETAVDVMSAKMAGLTTSADTLKWWGQQSEQARQILQEAYDGGAPTLRSALLSFNGYLSQFGDDVCVWGNGSDFDNAFLAVAMRACDIEPAWKFWNNRCFRTLKNSVGREFYKLPMPEREGTHHNALDDARYQARCAMVLLEHLAELQSLYETITLAKGTPGAEFTNVPSALNMIYLPDKLNGGGVLELATQKLDDPLPTFTDIDGAPKLDGVLYPKITPLQNNVPRPWPDGKSPSVLDGMAPREIRDFTPTYLNMDSNGGVSLGGYVGAPPAGFPEVGRLVIPADRSKPAYVELSDNTPVDLPVEKSLTEKRYDAALGRTLSDAEVGFDANTLEGDK